MPLGYVTDEAILTEVLGGADPTDAQSDRARICADAVSAAIDTALNGYVVEADSAAESELARSALLDGVAAYQAFDAPSGVLTVGPDGAPVRLPVDILRASWPAIRRYAIPGIG
jgi:hypothetical protein